jgi:hypothetical protein
LHDPDQRPHVRDQTVKPELIHLKTYKWALYTEQSCNILFLFLPNPHTANLVILLI